MKLLRTLEKEASSDQFISCFFRVGDCLDDFSLWKTVLSLLFCRRINCNRTMNKPFYGVASMPKSQRCRSPLIQQPSQDTTWIPQALAHTTTLKRHSMDYPNGRSKFHHIDSKNASTKAVASKIPPSPLVLGTTAKQKDSYLSSHVEKNDRNNHFNKGIKIQKLRLKKLLSQFPQPTGLTQPQRRPFLRLPITLPGT